MFIDGRKDIIRHKIVLCHHIGLQPDTKGIGITETLYVTHTIDTHQTRLDIDIDVVRDKVLVVFAVNASDGEYYSAVSAPSHLSY